MYQGNGTSSDHLSPAVKEFLSTEVYRQTKPVHDVVQVWVPRVEALIVFEHAEAETSKAHRIRLDRNILEIKASIAQNAADGATHHAELLTAIAALGAVDQKMDQRIADAEALAKSARDTAADAHERAEDSSIFRQHSGDFVFEAARAGLLGRQSEARLARDKARTRNKTVWKFAGAFALVVGTAVVSAASALGLQRCGTTSDLHHTPAANSP